MTIATALADLNTSVANLTGAINALLLGAATNGTDIAASLSTISALIETEVANVNNVTVSVAAVPNNINT